MEKLVQLGPSTIVSGDIPFTPKAKKVIELAMDQARNLGHNYIGTEHLLLGLIREGEGIAAQVLRKLEAGLDKGREIAKELVIADSDKSDRKPEIIVPLLIARIQRIRLELDKIEPDLDEFISNW